MDFSRLLLHDPVFGQHLRFYLILFAEGTLGHLLFRFYKAVF